MFYDVFAMLCDDVGKKPSAVAAELEIDKSTVSRWKIHEPTDSNMTRIARYFNVDKTSLKEGRIVYIAENGKKKESPKTDFLLDQGGVETLIEFSAKYSQLTEVQKKLVSDLIDTFLSDSK